MGNLNYEVSGIERDHDFIINIVGNECCSDSDLTWTSSDGQSGVDGGTYTATNLNKMTEQRDITFTCKNKSIVLSLVPQGIKPIDPIVPTDTVTISGRADNTSLATVNVSVDVKIGNDIVGSLTKNSLPNTLGSNKYEQVISKTKLSVGDIVNLHVIIGNPGVVGYLDTIDVFGTVYGLTEPLNINSWSNTFSNVTISELPIRIVLEYKQKTSN